MREIIEDRWQGILAILFLVAASIASYMAIGWLWEQLDGPDRILLVLGSSIALYGFGWCMDRVTASARKERNRR